jgi:hypothetical protein
VIAALTYNIVFRAKHIKGKANVIADYLSRSQFQKARALAPWVDPHQTAIPDHFSFQPGNHARKVGNYSFKPVFQLPKLCHYL